jgi:hypothetical protein
VKVRIKATPRQDEVDGVRLDRFTPGTVREVSPILGAWLIAEQYADVEMRESVKEHSEDFVDVKDPATRAAADDRASRPRRRKSD